MEKVRVLYISQEIFPYLNETTISKIGRNLPQGIQERGKEIRTFMPKYGCINERRHQLHEVIRLSGMNLIIDDNDHPLIIKVASIQPARMQVYFIDNEEFFQRKATVCQEDNKLFKDNDERSIFFCRGALETVKKLGWVPDVIHCNGWLSAMAPILIKSIYKNDPVFENTKIVYSLYNESSFKGSLDKKLIKKLAFYGIPESDLALLKDPTFENLTKFALSKSDAVIYGDKGTNKEIDNYIKELGLPTLSCQDEECYIEKYSHFYDEVLNESSVLVN
jgi:starch synthase